MTKFIVYNDEDGDVINVDSIDRLISVDVPNSDVKTSIRIGKEAIHTVLTVSELMDRITEGDNGNADQEFEELEKLLDDALDGTDY